MKHITLALFFSLFAAPAFALHCPADMDQVDAALAAGTTLSDADLEEIHAWRAEGEALHKAGDHQAAVDTLAKAKAKLGLE